MIQVSIRVAFTSEERQGEELDTRIGKASTIMQALHYSVILKRVYKNSKVSIFNAVLPPLILTNGRECCAMTERVQPQVQATEMRFLRRIEGVTLFDKVRSSEFQKSLDVKSIILRIERF